jgi:hypothetical protein
MMMPTLFFVLTNKYSMKQTSEQQHFKIYFYQLIDSCSVKRKDEFRVKETCSIVTVEYLCK